MIRLSTSFDKDVEKIMTIEEILAYYGNGNKFEKVTGFSRQNVLNWKKRGGIPLGTQYKIECASKGVLVAHRSYLSDEKD